jgi:hypothetical protein
VPRHRGREAREEGRRAGEGRREAPRREVRGQHARGAERHAGAATREGSVGTFDRSGRMAAPFVDATMELKVGEVSHVVETDFGFHIIYRSE